MLTQLQIHYPKGSLVTELVAIDHGQYIVRCLVQNEGTILVTGMAAAHAVEVAEDQARNRALQALGLSLNTTVTQPAQTSVISDQGSMSSTPMPTVSTPVAETPVLPVTKPSPSVTKTQPIQPEIPTTREPSKLFSVEANTPEVTQTTTASQVVEELTVAEPLVSNELSFAEPLPFDSAEVETVPEVESDWMTQKVSSATPETPVNSYQKELEPETTSGVSSTAAPIDFSDVIARTNVELKRLGWTNQQGRDYLVQTYGKRSRQLLTDDELLDFLKHLESEPSP
jgi:hypothetical protein